MTSQHEQQSEHTTQDLSGNILHIVLPSTSLCIIPELCFEDFGSHGLGFFLGIIFADSCENKKTLANGRDQLAVHSDRSRLDSLNDS